MSESNSRGRNALAPELVAELEQIAAQAGCELVHGEFKAGVLRLFIDKPEGVSLADCQHVSKQVSALLDVVEFGIGRYVLEVSSPGLDRQLYRPRDYERFLGRKVRVTFESPGARKRTVVGRLAEFHPDTEEVVVLDEEKNERLALKLEYIKLARLEVEL